MPVNKTTEFESSRIEICRNCRGTGRVRKWDGEEKTCPICDGRGRVRKTTKGVLTVESL